MRSNKMKARLTVVLLTVLFAAGCFIFIAYARTWGKTDLEFKIHINEQLVLQSVFGEPPTFAIWIENPDTGETQTIFVTKRAGLDDWEGKADVPSALPHWDRGSRKEKQLVKEGRDIDAISGATPLPGYFTTRVQVEPGSNWVCWIEMNLSGDYNEHYPEYDEKIRKTDEYGTGQPALVYKANITAVEGNMVVPEAIGMSLLDKDGKIRPLEGITTALDIFDEITVTVVKPKPKVL
ncbi:MAG: DUF2271 domain-containing protein [Flavobacteriaceae bacterium]